MSEPKKRRGRPSQAKANSEENNVDANNDLQDNTSRKKTLSVPKTDDSVENKQEDQQDVHDNDDSYTEVSNNDMDNFDKELQEEIEQEFEDNSNINDIPEEDEDPLKDSVKDRSYTDGINNSNTSENTQDIPEREIGEPEYKGGGKALPDIDDTLVNPNSASNSTKTNFNDIPNDVPPNPNNSGNGGGNGNNTNGSSTSKKEPKQEKPQSDNLKELSPKEKRDAIEKTADVILLGYQQYCPMPFIYFSSYNEKKLEKLHEENEINLDTPVKRDGTTFREYVVTHNQKVEQAFIVSDKEIEELREPLIDVLSEQEIAFTPMQRLLFTLGQQLMGKIFLMIKFLRDKHNDINTMKEMHAENIQKMEAIRQQNERIMKNQRQQQQRQYTHQQSSQPVNDNIKVTNQQPPQSNQQETNNESNVEDATVVKETKNTTVEKIPTLDDILETENGESGTETNDSGNDIPND